MEEDAPPLGRKPSCQVAEWLIGENGGQGKVGLGRRKEEWTEVGLAVEVTTRTYVPLCNTEPDMALLPPAK